MRVGSVRRVDAVAMRLVPGRAILLVGWLVVCVLSAALLAGTQRGAEHERKRRFNDRAELAARYTATYVRDLLEQERRVASHEFSASVPSAADFERVTTLFGYNAAVLLDAHGRVLRISPTTSSLIGRDLTRKYAHLRAATAGTAAVSDVVRVATTGSPIVAFAIPFGSMRGRQVFSGAFAVQRTPLGAYLRNVSARKGARVYLIDSAETVLASSRNDLVAATLDNADPDLARALIRSPAGQTGDGYQYASRRVAGTPWRLVLAAPSARSLDPIQRARGYLPWMLWGGFVLGGFACVLLVANLIASRTKLRCANADLDRLARTDALTGLYNRRQAQTSLDQAVANAHRYDHALSVLMIDIDHFKQINDSHGHAIGDDVLRFVATLIRQTLRAGDVVARWGGEEFLAVLPSTDRNGAEIVAERLRDTISQTPVISGDHVIAVSVSIGVAALIDQQPDELVTAADTAMYTAKTAGRDGIYVAR